MQINKKKVKVDSLESKLSAVTNQLLDLGKRNRLLNYRDSGLKTLMLINKNTEEIFRAVKGYKDLKFFDTDQALLDNHNNLPVEEQENDDILHMEYEICNY